MESDMIRLWLSDRFWISEKGVGFGIHHILRYRQHGWGELQCLIQIWCISYLQLARACRQCNSTPVKLFRSLLG